MVEGFAPLKQQRMGLHLNEFSFVCGTVPVETNVIIFVIFRELGDVINRAKFCVVRLNCFEVEASGSSLDTIRRWVVLQHSIRRALQRWHVTV